jgi:acetate kinase
MAVMAILTINVGSSTAKLAVFDAAGELRRVAATEVVRSDGSALDVWPSGLASQSGRPDVVVHRLVHGGDEYADPVLVTPEVFRRFRQIERLAPEHMPPALDAIEAAIRVFPAARQIACFDTAFHRDMPQVARMYPLSRRFWNAGVRRYGFHGLSCESIMDSLRRIDPDTASGRIVVAHLGGGSSLTAIRHGRSVDTTMGFSPAGGVMMSRRSGDLDPGVLLHLLAGDRVNVAALRDMVTHDAGLAGVSERSGDMRELLAAEGADHCAAEAVTLYCYLAKKALGGLIAALGGLDTLVFTGGIGEHAAPVRERIVGGMAELGLRIDPSLNKRHASVISSERSPVTIRVIPAAEDRALAAHAVTFLSRSQ